MTAPAIRRLRRIAAKAGLGVLRDRFLDLEAVSRISRHYAGRATTPAASNTRDRSCPPFLGDPTEWIQPGDRVDRRGDATFGWDALRRRAAARIPLTEASSPAFTDGATEIAWSSTANLASGPQLSDPPARYVTCDARNLVIDFDRLYPTQTTRHRPLHKRGPGRQYHRYRAGALRGACRWSPAFQLDAMPRDLLRDIFGSFRPWTGEPAIAYDEIVEHPVLFVTREGDESRNAFHAMTDFLNAFETILMANDAAPEVSRQDLEVVLLDNAPSGWLDPLWPQIFAPGRGVRRVGDFAGKRVLFRQALFSAPGYQSFLFAYLTRDNAQPEPVGMLDAFAALVLRSFGLSPAAPRKDGPLRITLISRQPYDRNVAATSGSVRATSEYFTRRVTNETACAETLTALGDVDVRLIDFARYPLEEQIRIARDTDLLIGVHGAGLTHLLWTPPHAGLLEIAPVIRPGVFTSGPRAGMDWTIWRVFPNLASWTGRPHTGIECLERWVEHGTELTINVEQLAGAARDLIAQVRRRGSIY